MARFSVSPLGGTPDFWLPLPKIRGLYSPISREAEACIGTIFGVAVSLRAVGLVGDFSGHPINRLVGNESA